MNERACMKLFLGVKADTICARNVTGQSCQGDSGGFVGSERNGRTEIDAVVSFGGGLCDAGVAVGFQVRDYESLFGNILRPCTSINCKTNN